MRKLPGVCITEEPSDMPKITKEEAVAKLRQNLFELQRQFVGSKICEQTHVIIQHMIKSVLLQYASEYSLPTSCVDVMVEQCEVRDPETGVVFTTDEFAVIFNCIKKLLPDNPCPWCIVRKLIW